MLHLLNHCQKIMWYISFLVHLAYPFPPSWTMCSASHPSLFFGLSNSILIYSFATKIWYIFHFLMCDTCLPIFFCDISVVYSPKHLITYFLVICWMKMELTSSFSECSCLNHSLEQSKCSPRCEPENLHLFFSICHKYWMCQMKIM
jgi:hypothetical protein